MRNHKVLLTTLVQGVTFLFAAFGGFLKQIAPPEETGASYAVGILSFLSLIVLLIVSALARLGSGRKFRRAWIVAGAVVFASAIPPSLMYPTALRSYTWTYPQTNPIRRVRGSDVDFTQDVKDYLNENPGQSSDPQALAFKFDLNDLWTPESISRASTKLLVLYAWLVLSVSTSIFCLLEAQMSEVNARAT